MTAFAFITTFFEVQVESYDLYMCGARILFRFLALAVRSMNMALVRLEISLGRTALLQGEDLKVRIKMKMVSNKTQGRVRCLFGSFLMLQKLLTSDGNACVRIVHYRFFFNYERKVDKMRITCQI